MRGLLALIPTATLGLSPAALPAATARPSLSAPAVPGSPLPLAPSLAAATPLVAAPAPAPVPALPALRAAASSPMAPPDAPSEAASRAAGVPFGESAAGPAAPVPVFEPGLGSPRHRLAPLGFEHPAPSSPEGLPAARAPEPKPFLLRHYRAFRFFIAPLVRLVYSVRTEGRPHLPDGPALVVPNHVSFMDPVLLSFAADRPMRFLMIRDLYETPGLEWLFRSLGAIPISPKDPKEVIEESLYRARRALAAGETVVVFPEGQLTRDGDFSPFRRGFERVAAGTGAPVIPAYIEGMWGSAFSRRPGASLKRSLRDRLRGRRRVGVRFGPALPRADSALARDAVARLSAPRAP